MMTGGGILVGAMRNDVVVGLFLDDVVACHARGLEGGAWLDAPDYFAAGSTRRVEEWRGNEGRAYPDLTTAHRS